MVRICKRILRGISACLLIAVMMSATIVLAVLAREIWPTAPGMENHKDGMLTVDSSNSNKGYIMASSDRTGNRLKLRVNHEETDTLYTYDLNGEGRYEVIPLQQGCGEYTCTLFENVKGNRYAQAGQLQIQAEVEEENLAFLYPNQYVNYDSENEAVKISNLICAGLYSDQEKFEVIKKYITDNYVYDFDRAKKLTSGTLPDINYCLENKKGICQDLAAMAACMLRVQGIPTKLVIGYADRYYHAWNNVYIDGEMILYDPTVELNNMYKNVKYTVERYY